MGFVGEFGAARVSPRELLSSYVGHLVCIEGIVTKASTVRPKWVRSVHYCPTNGKTLTREYRCGHRSSDPIKRLKGDRVRARPSCTRGRVELALPCVRIYAQLSCGQPDSWMISEIVRASC